MSFHFQKCQLLIIPYELTIIIINVDNVSSELLIKDQTTVNRLFSEGKRSIQSFLARSGKIIGLDIDRAIV